MTKLCNYPARIWFADRLRFPWHSLGM